MEIISNEAIVEALKKANPLIQHAFGSKETTDTIIKIQKRYNLHTDVLGAVSQELGNLLLGLIDPSAFFMRIQERGVNNETAKSIVDDINREIFVPLQKKIRDGVKIPDDEDEDDLIPPQEAAKSSIVTPFGEPGRPQQIPVMNVGTPTFASVSTESNPVPTQEPPAYNLIRPETQTPTQTASENTVPQRARTMASDVQALTHPETVLPQVRVTPAPADPHPWQTSPAQSFQTASVPYTSMPPQSRAIPAPPVVQLPGEWKPAPIHTDATPVLRPKTASTVSSRPVEPLTKEYGSDPYREPIT